MSIQTINPATNEQIALYDEMSDVQVAEMIHGGHHAYLKWREISIEQRAEYIKNIADILRKRKSELALITTEEMGKPLHDAIVEIEKCADLCDYYAEDGKAFLQPKIIETRFEKSYIKHDPLGVVLMIMPWNFPYWQAFRFSIPTILAGNTCLLKHASNVSGVALAIESVFEEAGFPTHILSTLLVSPSQINDIIHDKHVVGVSLTGSEKTGRIVAAQAGDALKKVVLELGGNDPYIVLSDADLTHAAKVITRMRLLNSGQVCISAKRIIVEKTVFSAFEEKMMQEIDRYVVGNPMDKAVHLGPLARADLVSQLQTQVDRSIALGAQLVKGGKPIEGKGNYYPITLLKNVQKGMPAYDEELFGPVITLIEAEDEEDAIRIANDSLYGLSAVVFTQDLKRGEKIASQRLEAGTCCVNVPAFSDPRFPFGGIKHSGFGRELSEEGMKEFVNIKTIHVAK